MADPKQPNEFVAITTIEDYQARFENDYKERFDKDFQAGIKDRLKRQNEQHQQALVDKDKQLLAKYEIESLDLLDDFVSKGKGYQKLVDEKEALSNTFTTTKSEYETLQSQYKDLQEQYLIYKANVDDKRIDDLKAFFKGKEQEINEESLKAFLEQNPQFIKKVISVNVGDDKGDKKPHETDFEELRSTLDKALKIKR